MYRHDSNDNLSITENAKLTFRYPPRPGWCNVYRVIEGGGGGEGGCGGEVLLGI